MKFPVKLSSLAGVILISLVVLALVGVFATLGLRQPGHTASSSAQVVTTIIPSLGTPTATVTVTPTPGELPPGPIGTVVAPPEPQRPTPGVPDPPRIAPKAEDPVYTVIDPLLVADLKASVNGATVIAIGSVKQIFPARWSTSDGKRPANPYVQEPGKSRFIFAPVLIEVEQYLKGEQPQKQLVLAAAGGKVGLDEVIYNTKVLYHFTEGQRVIVFLDHQTEFFQDSNPIWYLSYQYNISQAGLSVSEGDTMPLSQLIDKIRQALSQ